MKNSPIGVFDSGIGGLTVFKEIMEVLPNEDLIYLGDTARVPYGTRSKQVITKFSIELAQFLLKKKVKFLVVSCNTISAISIEAIKKVCPVFVLGVINPAAKLAAITTKNNKIGVIGTPVTINSKMYQKKIRKFLPEAEVFTQACPLFVPLIEEGLTDHFATWQIAKEYLKNFKGTKIDTLILGCTHYPMIKEIIQDIVGNEVTIIDSARPTAFELKRILFENNMLKTKGKGKYQIYVTDAPERVFKVANFFFGNHLPVKPRKVTL